MTQYTQISIGTCLNFPKNIPCDVYVRLGKDRYTKIFHKGHKLDLERFYSYQEKGVQTLWVHQADHRQYVDGIKTTLQDMIAARRFSDEAFLDFVDELCGQSLGIVTQEHTVSKETFQYAKTSIEAIIKLAESDVFGVAKLIQKTKNRPRLLKHLISTAVLSIMLARADEKLREKNDPILLKIVGIAALLHDMGLSHLPYTPDEHSTLLDPKTDPEILSHVIWPRPNSTQPLQLPKEIKMAIEQHHERWDGTGYPNSLKKDQIYYPARVIAVADYFSGLTVGSDLRPPVAPREAFVQLRANAGLDPQLVQVFFGIFHSKPH